MGEGPCPFCSLLKHQLVLETDYVNNRTLVVYNGKCIGSVWYASDAANTGEIAEFLETLFKEMSIQVALKVTD